MNKKSPRFWGNSLFSWKASACSHLRTRWYTRTHISLCGSVENYVYLTLDRQLVCYGQWIMISFPKYATVVVSSSLFKVNIPANSIRSRLKAWFGSPIIKKIPEYHPRNVYGYVEIWMYIMSKYSTIPNCSKFDFLVYIFYISCLKPWESNLCLIYFISVFQQSLILFWNPIKQETNLKHA
jgi:hypothetical protein